jgi:hypothetical protein
MADSSDSSGTSSDSDGADSGKASPKDVEALDGNVSAPKKKKQKILFDFFKKKRKRGRPKKVAQLEEAKPKRGRPPSRPMVDPLLPASSNPSLPIAHQKEDCAKKPASKRINWAYFFQELQQ